MRLILSVFLCLLLLGCTTRYGNYAQTPMEYDTKLASDTVKQLVKLYPPARTRFAIKQPTPDYFGATLVSSLRSNGYALTEYKQIPTAQSGEQQPNAIPDIDLYYIVDRQMDLNLYRVSLRIGQQSLTRAYAIDADKQLRPAGAWSWGR